MAVAIQSSPGRRPLLVVGAATGLAVIAGSVALPAARFLRAPEVTTLVAGIVVMACGLWAIRLQVAGRAPVLVFAAGVAWLVPDLGASGLGWFDDAMSRLALLHVGLLTHALTLRAVRRGALRAVVVSLGYACAASAVVGGYRTFLGLTGIALVVVGLLTPRKRVAGLATAAACVGFGAGLALPQAALLLTGSSVTSWGAGLHAATFAAAAGLLTYAMTAVTTQTDPILELDRTLSAELGTPVSLVLSDGADGWLDPSGNVIEAPTREGTTVRDADGGVVGRLLGVAVRPDARVVRTVMLAGTNARLRHDQLRQVDELAASRARVVAAAEDERRAVLHELRRGILEPLDDLEQRLRVAAGTTGVADRAADTRSRIERLAEAVDPFRPDETLADALRRMAGPASRGVVVRDCVEPVDPSVRRACWFCCAEALANARKHAPGAAVDLAVASAPGGVVVRVTDDGPGGADEAGSGLAGLRDRVRFLGGTLHVESGPAGTVVEAWLPDLVLVVDHDASAGPASYREVPRHGGGPS